MKKRIVSLSDTTVSERDTILPEEEYRLQKESLKKQYKALPGLHKAVILTAIGACSLVVIQFIWIIALQYQISLLQEQTRLQEIRLVQLEQASDKHNNLLYSTYESLQDLTKKWHDLRFQVLENTWKLGN